MNPGQLDIDECISIVENTCPDCPDPGTCEAEDTCSLDLQCAYQDAEWAEA